MVKPTMAVVMMKMVRMGMTSPMTVTMRTMTASLMITMMRMTGISPMIMMMRKIQKMALIKQMESQPLAWIREPIIRLDIEFSFVGLSWPLIVSIIPFLVSHFYLAHAIPNFRLWHSQVQTTYISSFILWAAARRDSSRFICALIRPNTWNYMRNYSTVFMIN